MLFPLFVRPLADLLGMLIDRSFLHVYKVECSLPLVVSPNGCWRVSLQTVIQASIFSYGQKGAQEKTPDY